MSSSSDFLVEVEQEGRSGTIVYVENDKRVSFFWEYIVDGIGISIPPDAEWNKYCHEQGANWAAGRREEILHKVGASLAMRYGKGDFDVTDHWLNVHHGQSLVSRLLSRLKLS